MPPNGIGARSSPFTSYRKMVSCHFSVHAKFRKVLSRNMKKRRKRSKAIPVTGFGGL
jgi:hypothetical protein